MQRLVRFLILSSLVVATGCGKGDKKGASSTVKIDAALMSKLEAFHRTPTKHATRDKKAADGYELWRHNDLGDLTFLWLQFSVGDRTQASIGLGSKSLEGLPLGPAKVVSEPEGKCPTPPCYDGALRTVHEITGGYFKGWGVLVLTGELPRIELLSPVKFAKDRKTYRWN